MFVKLPMFLLTLAVVGCGVNSQQVSVPSTHDLLVEQTRQNGRACVRISDISGYGFNDTVVAIDGKREYYLATTRTHCQNMAMSVRAAFKGPQGEICGGGSSRIVTADDSCTIRGLFQFENRKSAFEMLERVGAKKEQLAE